MIIRPNIFTPTIIITFDLINLMDSKKIQI